jgi:2-phospho-L-lactate transferase/gluconeogenesis factor (CofD/UPF0052 family)
MPVSSSNASRQGPNVVLFSGGRGSGALTRQLLTTRGISLTIAINGYDDGASTGEVRRFLGDSLGPSDFRKNASRVAAAIGSCSAALIELLDLRLPAEATAVDAEAVFAACRGQPSDHPVAARVSELVASARHEVAPVSERLDRFRSALAGGGAFDFGDCSLGNLVFAGAYLRSDRRFNRAVDDYCALLGLPPGLIENVTDGTNAWLVAVDDAGRVLATEEAIVRQTSAHRIRDIFLLDGPLSEADLRACGENAEACLEFLQGRSILPSLNPRLATAIKSADLIVYAAGTQHSSLFPSYLTRGLNAAVAANLRAMKLLLTNIQPDAEIGGSSAVEIIDRAVYYLQEKGRLPTPAPCLITHYLLNDPGHHEPDRPYVPLGPIDTIEDPRLVRISNYEDGVSGRHDASQVLAPYLEALGRGGERKKVAVLLHDVGSSNKLVQTLLEIVRGGIERVPVTLTVFFAGLSPLDASFTASLPFPVHRLDRGELEFRGLLRSGSFDYVVLFESSGMYRGEDLVAMATHLAVGRFDAVWGSRRLSIRDIEASYRLRYRRTPAAGLLSFAGSYVLSVAYLLLFGHYITDTLSGVRAVRASDAAAAGVELTHKQANHQLLTALLGRKADILEIPVQFLPMSPEQVKRTTPLDGLRALGMIIGRRFAPVRQ